MQGTSTKPGLLSDAVQAIRIGHRRLAREILIRVIESEPQNEHAFLWLAAIADTRDEALSILERVLVINPTNTLVSNALGIQRLSRAVTSPTSSLPSTAKGSCPVCQTARATDAVLCQACGAPYTLEDFHALQTNGGANERRIEEAIKTWKTRLQRGRTFDASFAIGLGYLSMYRSGDALPYLRQARDLRPNTHTLDAACEELEQRKLILVVDDSATVRRLVSITLERQGHRVRAAVNGLDGLESLKQEQPDLVLLDVNMPKMDGYELAKSIRRSPGAKLLPILMLSGNDGVFDKVRGKMAGATDYLTKPFQGEVLLAALNKLLPAASPSQSHSILSNR